MDALADSTMPAAPPLEAATELKRRYGDIVDRITIPVSAGLPPEQIRELLAGLH